MQKYKVLVLLGILTTLSTSALAAPTPDEIARSEALLRERERMEEMRRREEAEQARLNAPDARQDKDKKDIKRIELPEEEQSFFIEKIIVESSMKNKFRWLDKNLAYYENKKIGIQGINLIAKYIGDKIIDNGYVTTRVTIPEQDLTKGTLKLQIIPGLINDIRFADEKTSGTWENAFPTKRGDILNVRNLEQGLEQMKRVPNQDVNMEIVPASNPGESDVVLTIKRTKAWTMGFSLDDANIKTMGRLQGSVNLSLYNPTGFNDVISYSYGKNAESNNDRYGTRNYSLSYSIPFKNYTFSINKYKSRFYQTVASINPFLSKSTTDTIELGITRLLYRDQMRKTQAGIKLIKRERRSFIDDTELLVQRQETTAYQINLSHRQYIGKSVLDAYLYYQKGIPWWGARPGLSDKMLDMPTTRYSLVGFNVNWMTPLKLGKTDARYTFTMRGQFSNHVLYSNEQFSIGGRYTVRGFDGEQTLSAENGVLIRNELSIPLKKLKAEVYLGIDAGRVWGHSDMYLLGRDLIGSVIGLRGTLFKNMQYDVFAGMPLYKPDGFKTDSKTFGFQVYWSF